VGCGISSPPARTGTRHGRRAHLGVDTDRCGDTSTSIARREHRYGPRWPHPTLHFSLTLLRRAFLLSCCAKHVVGRYLSPQLVLHPDPPLRGCWHAHEIGGARWAIASVLAGCGRFYQRSQKRLSRCRPCGATVVRLTIRTSTEMSYGLSRVEVVSGLGAGVRWLDSVCGPRRPSICPDR